MVAKVIETKIGWFVKYEKATYGPFPDMWYAMSGTPYFHYTIFRLKRKSKNES